MAELTLTGISKRFGGDTVIDDLALQIRSGEFMTILGPSGCGKTTLLRMIAGLESIDKGDIFICGKRYNDIPAQARPIAMVFQSYALFPHMSVRDNILFGLRIKKAAKHEMFEKLGWVIPMLRLEGLEARLPREISGGQRQRVALARALVLDPAVLLLDEPLSNLDAALRERAIEELKRMHRSVGKTIVYVTHNQAEAMTMSDRIAVLRQGKLEQYDTPEALYDRPATVFAAQFIGSPAMNLLAGEIVLQDGGVGVATEAGFIRIDRERGNRANGMVGREVMLGIRPQGMHYGEGRESRRVSDTRIALCVELVQSMGDRSLVVGRGGGGTLLRFLITRDDDVAVDQTLDITVDGRRIHVFDPSSRENLFV